MWATRMLAVTTVLWTSGVSGPPAARAEHPDRLSCLPISTCGDNATTPDGQRCPDGNACVCVPSCPVCDDCAAQVCVPVEIACHSACDCPEGMGCAHGSCSADAEPTYCCDDERCPTGEKCQDRRGNIDVCQRECRTACDCAPGLGCFDGQCIAGIAPIYCCEGDVCPAGQQCQNRDGSRGRCAPECVDTAWLCRSDGSGANNCGDDRECSCTASCPTCEDCGPNVCIPPGSPTPYRCNDDGTCASPRDKCISVSSCPECDDVALNVCVPRCENDDPMCAKRLRVSQRRIRRVIEKTRPCRADDECVAIDPSTECRGSCPAYVNGLYARRVQNFIDHVDERYCSGYQEDGCPYSTPSCQQTVGACVRGRCTAVPAAVPGPDPLPIDPQPIRPGAR